MRRSAVAVGHKRDRGAVAVIAAIFIVVAMILIAFVVDRGRIYVVQAQLQNGVDAAALAAGIDICVGGDAVGTAVSYGVQNGVDIAPEDVVVSPVGRTEYVNVRATTNVDLFFGAFVATPEVSVRAQATVERSCYTKVKMFSITDIDFKGSGTVGGSMYAGRCFLNTGSGNLFDTVATASPYGVNAVPACGPGNNSIEPEETVKNEIYNQPEDIFALLDDQGFTQLIEQVKQSNSPAVSCASIPGQGTQEPWVSSKDIYCTGGGAISIPGVEYRGSIVSDGPITMDNNTILSGANQIIYTSDASQTGNGAIGYRGDVGATTYLVAPYGYIKEMGSDATLSGALIGYNVGFSGGGQDTTGGVFARIPGPFTLIQ